MTMRRALAAGLVTLAGSCAPVGHPTLDDIAEGYVKTALQLAQHNPDFVDDWHGPDAWRPGPRQPVAILAGRLKTLQEDVKRRVSDVDGKDGDRLNYLDDQLMTLAVLADRLSGVSISFDEELGRSFRTGALKNDGVPASEARAALDTLLPGKGPLADRYARYRKGLAVPPSRVETVMRVALAACRDAGKAMNLPADEGVDLVFGHGSQWDGFARYLGDHRTRIEINLDASLDVTRALRLACHEGYPGHHAQNVLIDDELVKKRGWKEFQLTPSFGRFLFVTEGAAEVGADLAFPRAQRIALYRKVLLPAAGLPPSEADRLVDVEERLAALEPVIADVSRAYLDSTLTQGQAIDRLRDEALTPDPEALLAFAERRRARILAYPEGRAAVRRTIGDTGISGLRQLFTDQPFRLF
jgi:hypothetical protein